jgi:predicted TPR repeat methyltransferase
MNRHDRRKARAAAPPARPAVPASLSDMLLGHAGQGAPARLDEVGLAKALADSRAGNDPAMVRASIQSRIVEIERALIAEPRSIKLLLDLVRLQKQLGREAAVLQTYRRCLAIDPRSGYFRHMVDALAGDHTPPRADDAYVRGEFESMASIYDDTIVRALGFRVPALIGDAARRAMGAARAPVAVLDLGCGTGLCGVEIKALARVLDGVDLSARMIERAKARAIYDQLSVGEIGAHLAATTRRYALVVAGDVLVYFGALDGVLSGVARVLEPGGAFVFTAELHAGEGYHLRPTGRYAHGEAYLRDQAARAGFAVARLEREVLRHDYGQPIDGLVVTFRRP